MGVGEGRTISCLTGDVCTLCLLRVEARLCEECLLQPDRRADMNFFRVSTVCVCERECEREREGGVASYTEPGWE